MKYKSVFFIMNRKIIATGIVAVVFLYFWVNGPLLQTIELINLESIETKYSNPLMVGVDGVDKKKEIDVFSTINLEEQKSFGHGLILKKKTALNNWGFIADVKNNPGLSKELESQILEHAQQLSEKEQIVQTHPSTNLYYATISGEKYKNIYLESTDLVNNVRGYAGKINVGIVIGEDGLIRKVIHISSKETSSYLEDITNAGFYNSFKTISLTQGKQEIDAVSGATLTSEAIAKTVSQLIDKSSPYPISNYAEIDEVNFFSLSAILNNTWVLHISVIFLMFVFAFQKWKKKSKKSILALSFVSVIYIGFFLNNSFTYISFIHPFVGTSVSSLIGLYSLFVLLGAIWGKNTYCKYVCPFGNVQRLVIQLNPLQTRRKFFLSNKWTNRVRGALTVILIAGVLLGIRNWSNFELFPDLFGLSMLSTWFFIALVTVLTTMVYPMIWCRLLCPTGSVLDGISDVVNSKHIIKWKK